MQPATLKFYAHRAVLKCDTVKASQMLKGLGRLTKESP